jgi:ATP-dependent RNA helicase RhlE
MKFEELNLIHPILKALKEEGYETPTPIQAKAIPAMLQKKDILGCAQTGTGKTAAFAVPALQLLNNQNSRNNNNKGRRKIKCLIVTPTRELAVQIGENFKSYGKYLHLKHAVIFGGVKQYIQTRQLKKGVDIVIATPGRLLDLMNQGHISLKGIQIFTLDEADRMLDMGFIHDIKKIISKLPEKKQSLFFSATMPPPIVALTKKLLKNPVRIEVAKTSCAAETVEQKIYHVEKPDKKSLLIHVLKEPQIKSALIFTRTKFGADKVARHINNSGIKAAAIHGNKSQNFRQKTLNRFKNKNIKILVATDIAARGIDINELSHVINYEIPNVPEDYVHRIGRTGRAGSEGKALSFCDINERKFIKNVERLIKKQIEVISEHPFKSTETANSYSAHSRSQKSTGRSFRRNSRSRKTGNKGFDKRHAHKKKRFTNRNNRFKAGKR